MILTINDASPSPQWSLRILFDYSIKHWRLLERPAPSIWNRIATETQGPFQLVDGGKVAWLWEKQDFTTKRNPLILWEPPVSSKDGVRTSGGGIFFEPKDGSLKGRKVQWSVAAAPGSVAAGNSIRGDALALIERNLPNTLGTYVDPPNWVEKTDHGDNTAKNASGFRSTGCGGLPGQMFKDLEGMGWPIPNDMVDGTNPKYTGVKRGPNDKPKWMKLAGSSTGYKFIVQDGIEKRLGKPGQIYVEYQKGGRLPQPGDVYVLAIKGSIWNRPVLEGKKIVGYERVASFRHVGVVYEIHDDHWITADGGQDGPKKSGFAIGYTKRSFDPKTGLVGGIGEKGELDGWIDMEALVGE